MVEKLVGLTAVVLADKWAAMKELIDAHGTVVLLVGSTVVPLVLSTVVPLVFSWADLMAVLMAHE